ncbi:hypothetical protein DdX_17965 [Ditylenchus destructor]|uniref:Secreted protein n=1 Tax=Ditylenchus destructor TaxID=166010 RepID=A0AAD4QYP8_9BILA|nr:hypothetical protein DdX_17965 [Ditylenchus destructor]
MVPSKAVAITAVLFAVVLAIDASKQVGGARTCSSNGTCGVKTAVLTQQEEMPKPVAQPETLCSDLVSSTLRAISLLKPKKRGTGRHSNG